MKNGAYIADRSKQLISAAEKIVELINNEFPEEPTDRIDSIWLAFQAVGGPASAGEALERYGVTRPASSR